MPSRFRRLVPIAAALLLLAASAGNAAAVSTDFPHTSHGNRGVNVKALQHLLRHHGATLAPTGLYDTTTVRAVRAFQSRAGITATGEVGATTWKALIVRLDTGSTGEAVIAATRLLNEKRWTGLPDSGVWTSALRSAVVAFQRHVRIGETGVVGPVTWRYLLSHFERPVWGRTMCDYSVGNGAANWGTASAIGQIQAAAQVVVGLGHGRIPLGDIGYQHGGDIAGHQTHEQGLDVDIRPMRKARDQCRWGVNWRWSTYDRAATRALVKAIRHTAYGHVKLIYFNDPVLIREGLTTWYAGHDDHLHIRYCERVHPVRAYDC